MPSRKRPRHLREEPASFRAGPGLRAVAASEAKTHFAELLDAVERGETIAITRHGRAIARLVPDEKSRREQVRKALDEIKKLGKQIRERHGEMTLEELLSLRHEGHKY